MFNMRKCLRSSFSADCRFLAALLVGAVLMGLPCAFAAEEAIDVGTRRELFIDRDLIESLSGGAQQRMQRPILREVALEHDAAWEGTGCGYHNVFQDGDTYRMYYNARHLDVSEGGDLKTDRHPHYLCYAESDDGIQWRKPELGLVEFEGSTQNNIVLQKGLVGGIDGDVSAMAVFKDENPKAPADARYKAIVLSKEPLGLWPCKSPDGFHWTPMCRAPMLQDLGAFDSMNLAFWDTTIGKYRAYWRIFPEGATTDEKWAPLGVRGIRTATSDDMIHWGPYTNLRYEDSPVEELYTNQIKPYHRAPHILVGFPTRFITRPWSKSIQDLPDPALRKRRAACAEYYATALTEGLLMASRNGTHFTRWNEAFLRPGPERPDTWHYGHQFIAWHAVETPSTVPGAARELSIYASEGFWHGAGSTLRRYSLRLDGFVSINAPLSGGEVVTRPLIFSGDSLHLNFATSAAGGLRVELQTPEGTPVDGYGAADCDDLFGDTIDREVTWKGQPDVSAVVGMPVRLRFVMRDADLYAFQFQNP